MQLLVLRMHVLDGLRGGHEVGRRWLLGQHLLLLLEHGHGVNVLKRRCHRLGRLGLLLLLWLLLLSTLDARVPG